MNSRTSPLASIEVRDFSGLLSERQLTRGSYGHTLTNINAWTPDGQWLVYDVRANDQFDGTRIEMVCVATGEVRVIYESPAGEYCGVATVNPAGPQVVFMHSPVQPDLDWTYGTTRRRGCFVDFQRPGKVRPLDAMNYAPPYTPGALRGGSHLHVFSPDGVLVSFTYEDEVLARLAGTEAGWAINQRNIGVAGPGGPVKVSAKPHHHDGDYYSVIVTRTWPRPRPGSDEISRASEEGWVGQNGYLRKDGGRQRYALAFQGLVAAPDGREHAEVFIADLPDELPLTSDGSASMQANGSQYPSQARRVTQRRLTFTASRGQAGVARQPRHWLHSSPDGSQIAFLMADDQGVIQLWSVAPTGGEPRQISKHPWSVSSAFSWSHDGKHLAHVMDGSIFITEAASGRAARLTPRRDGNAAPSVLACPFSPDGRHVAFTRRAGEDGFHQVFCVAVPEN